MPRTEIIGVVDAREAQTHYLTLDTIALRILCGLIGSMPSAITEREAKEAAEEAFLVAEAFLAERARRAEVYGASLTAGRESRA